MSVAQERVCTQRLAIEKKIELKKPGKLMPGFFNLLSSGKTQLIQMGNAILAVLNNLVFKRTSSTSCSSDNLSWSG
jgi:hypothetical protein